MNRVIEKYRNEIIALCKTHHVKKLFVFGSATRNDFNDDSDIDLLNEFDTTGFNYSDLSTLPYDPFIVFFELKEKPETLFKRKIDLIPNQEFRNKYFQAEVEKSKQLVYAK
ncbi:MAG: nucleotidyltransferase domain-containing protein [Bacteroidetes bacterium]|nr:nucleotidyltransferase domain-containing protein [Bacteroidota bacterium]